jgi:hypothetical protein
MLLILIQKFAPLSIGAFWNVNLVILAVKVVW